MILLEEVNSLQNPVAPMENSRALTARKCASPLAQFVMVLKTARSPRAIAISGHGDTRIIKTTTTCCQETKGTVPRAIMEPRFDCKISRLI